MSSFQYRELLTKGEVFKKKPTTSTAEPDKCAYQESDGTYHAMVLSHFACRRQHRMLLKSLSALWLSENVCEDSTAQGLRSLHSSCSAFAHPRKAVPNLNSEMPITARSSFENFFE
jgi:hypothetical protein